LAQVTMYIAWPRGTVWCWVGLRCRLNAASSAGATPMCLGDIGHHFPPGDPKYKGISSLVLLGWVGKKLAEKGYAIGNIDSVIIAEQPLLRDYISDMCRNISQALDIDAGSVSVKANTSEELGFVGREEGMAVSAVALITGN